MYIKKPKKSGPRPGSVTCKVQAYLIALGPGASITRAGVAEITGKDIRHVGPLMAWGIEHGIFQRVVGGADFIEYKLAVLPPMDVDARDDDWEEPDAVYQVTVPAAATVMPKTNGFPSVWHLAGGA